MAIKTYRHETLADKVHKQERYSEISLNLDKPSLLKYDHYTHCSGYGMWPMPFTYH